MLSCSLDYDYVVSSDGPPLSCGRACVNLAHTASFSRSGKYAPSNAGTKHQTASSAAAALLPVNATEHFGQLTRRGKRAADCLSQYTPREHSGVAQAGTPLRKRGPRRVCSGTLNSSCCLRIMAAACALRPGIAAVKISRDLRYPHQQPRLPDFITPASAGFTLKALEHRKAAGRISNGKNEAGFVIRLSHQVDSVGFAINQVRDHRFEKNAAVHRERRRCDV